MDPVFIFAFVVGGLLHMNVVLYAQQLEPVEPIEQQPAQVGAAFPLPAYEVPATLRAADIPGLSLQHPEYAGLLAFQFGPQTNETLYLVFDCSTKFQQHDILWLYIPEDSQLGNPEHVRGRSDSDGNMAFRSILLESAFENVTIQYRISINTDTRWHPCTIRAHVTVDATIQIIRPKRRILAYKLVGRMRPSLHADSVFTVQQLLHHPVLTARWAQYARSIRLETRLKHGNFGFFPGNGFDRRADVRIMEGEELRARDRVLIESFGDREYFIYTPRRRLRSHTPHTTEITVNLDPLFDEQNYSFTHTFR